MPLTRIVDYSTLTSKVGWFYLDKLFYVALTILGLYFIGEGQVMTKFLSEKTNFAEYDEPIQELPTFTSEILGHKVKMSYQKDFNISFVLGNHVGRSVLTPVLERQQQMDSKHQIGAKVYS